MITDSVKGNVVISGATGQAVAEAAAARANTSSLQPAAPQKESSATQQDDGKVDLKTVEDAARQVAQFVGSIRSELSFSVDQASGINVVKVIDTNTKEVIRQIPSREIIQLAQALDKLQGLLVKEKA